MNRILLASKGLISMSIMAFCAFNSCKQAIIIDDPGGILGGTDAPVSVKVKLSRDQIHAAEEGRLYLLGLSAKNKKEHLIPVQLDASGGDTNRNIVMMMQVRYSVHGKYKLIEAEASNADAMQATPDPNSGQVYIQEGGKRVIQYNYQTIYEKDVIRPVGEQLEQHTRTEKDTFVTTSIYAVPRSDYIHPLFGLEGEMLTRDWPIGGHPHHRGIFWAWPEVEYGSERGDIYALQRIFARPTGSIDFKSGPVFAQIAAENLWMWEDNEPIVREHVVIRVYRAAVNNRIVDLTIKLDALKDSITIATRNTDSYGGLNLRMMTPQFQEISYFTDKEDSEPQRAWSDFNGIFDGAGTKSGLMILQHGNNPDYPGDWVEYADLAWVQPTFPAPGTRYPLRMEKSLILRYRLIIHAGGKPDRDISEKRWDALHHSASPIYVPANTGN